MTAIIVRKSPKGFMPYAILPLNTTIATPQSAMMEPNNIPFRSGNLYIMLPNSMVKIGAVHISRETLEAKVKQRALFSVMKYNVPPQRPHSIRSVSSFILLLNRRLGAMGRMHRYAMRNLYRNISVGERPWLISVLVDTNVTPHIQTVNMAMIW